MPTSHPEGFLAVPSSSDGSPVLVLHAWWGLNETIRSFCQKLAHAGFVAFAPDLYHGKIVDRVEDAEQLVSQLNQNADSAMAQVRDALAFLRQRSGASQEIAVIGFSLGASYALDLASAEPDQIRSVVLFYGTGGGDFSSAKAEFLGHFADNDPFEPKDAVDELEETLKRAGRKVTFYHYPDTGHWFFEPDRLDAYNRQAASLAWDRTLQFLRRPSAS